MACFDCLLLLSSRKIEIMIANLSCELAIKTISANLRRTDHDKSIKVGQNNEDNLIH